jgi:mycothiol synthase
MDALELEVMDSFDAPVWLAVRDLLSRHQAAFGYAGLSEERQRVLERTARHPGSDRLVAVAAHGRGSTELVGWSQVDGYGDGRTAVLELVTLPGPETADASTALVDALADAALAAFAARGDGPLRWWVGHATDADDARAARLGFVGDRDLLQLRCPLPLPARPGGRPTPAVATRAFRVGEDEEAWLVQNNRAFAGHPEQGGWDLDTLLERQAEPWFDPDGFRVLEVDGRIAGSCWTKVHGSARPPLGEIYVIGVDPDFHGRGWGRALTEDGFAWLAARGVDEGMLYVDAANAAAVALYRSMGMTTHHVDCAYVTDSVRPIG